LSKPPEVRRLLCIDDSEVVLERMKSALEPHGYEVLTTTQIAGAARHLPGCGLVIVDLHLPRFDGNEVLAALRKGLARTTGGGPTPLFYLYTSSAGAAEYVKIGFDGVFTRKGDDVALPPQVDAAFHRLKMREYLGARRSAT
jgi:CheY-like chemotaxis protein